MKLTSFKLNLSEDTQRILKELPETVKSSTSEVADILPVGALVRGLKRGVVQKEPEFILDSGVLDYDSADGSNYRLHVQKFRIPVDRPPVSMSQEHHEMFDAWFANEFGVAPRANSMFCLRDTGDGEAFSIANTYGVPCVVMPVNGFKYIWSPVYDDLYFASASLSLFTNEAEVDKMMKAGKYKMTDLDEVPAGHEIMVMGTEYYAISAWSGNVPLSFPEDDLKQAMIEASKGF